MSDQDSSASASQTDGEIEGEMDEEMDGEVEGEGQRDENLNNSSAQSLSSFSSSLRAVIRIKQKYQAMKKRRQELALGLGGAGMLAGAPLRTSPKIFTFDALTPSAFPALSSSLPPKKKRRRRKRVLFPNSGGRRAPPKQEQSRAKYCLYLLFAIVFLQVNLNHLIRPVCKQLVLFSKVALDDVLNYLQKDKGCKSYIQSDLFVSSVLRHTAKTVAEEFVFSIHSYVIMYTV